MPLRDFFGIPERRPTIAPARRALTYRPSWRGRPGRRGWDPVDSGRLFAGWAISTGSADEEVRLRQTIERGRARELERTNPWVVRYYTLFLANVFGEQGIRLVPRIINRQVNDEGESIEAPDREANDAVRNAWLAWGQRGECTVDGRTSWPDTQKLLGLSYKRDGEVFLRLYRGVGFGRYGFRIQPVEADHCSVSLNQDLGGGRAIKMGIERDRFDRPIAYWLSRRHPGDPGIRYFQSINEFERVPVDSVLHLYDARRIGQSRGLPALESGLASLHMLSGYEEAELVAARVSASKMGFYQTATGAEYTGEGEGDEGAELAEGEVREELEPGVIGQLPKDQTFVSFDPQHPTTAFREFVKHMIRRFAAGAGASYNSVANDLEGVNFSSLREGRLAERDLWKLDQSLFVATISEPVFEAWIRQAFLSGELGDTRPADFDRFRAHRWQPRRWEWIDPQKEAQANELSLDNLTTSLTAIIQSQGRETREVFEEIRAERDLAAEFGIADLLPYAQPRRNAPSSPPAGGDEA